MIKAIIFSGTPGTGKTSVSQRVSKILNARYFDVNDLIKRHEEWVEGYDNVLKTKIIDAEKVVKYIEREIKNSKVQLVIDSHISHLINPKYVEICFVLRCHPDELKIRLEKKGWDERKIKENIEAEVHDICLFEALQNGHKVHEIDTTGRKVEQTVGEVFDVLTGRKKPEYGKVRWMRDYYRKILGKL